VPAVEPNGRVLLESRFASRHWPPCKWPAKARSYPAATAPGKSAGS